MLIYVCFSFRRLRVSKKSFTIDRFHININRASLNRQSGAETRHESVRNVGEERDTELDIVPQDNHNEQNNELSGYAQVLIATDAQTSRPSRGVHTLLAHPRRVCHRLSSPTIQSAD